MPFWTRCLVAWLIGAPLTGSATGTEPWVSGGPNFVIILADDVGYGDSSVYGGWLKTPNLERMAALGLTFTDFHTSGIVCSPTRAGLITGRYQQRAGIPSVINADPGVADHYRGLQPSETTFAEALRDQGYRTGIFGKWHLGYGTRYNPIHHGFQEFVGFLSGNIDYLSHFDRMGKHDWWQHDRNVEQPGYLTHLITGNATDFIDRHRQESFCLFVSHGAMHTPLQAPGSTPIRGPDKQPATAAAQKRTETVRLMMQALDDSVGAILDALDRNSIADQTLVIFLSDNGGAAHMKCDPLRGKKGTVWEGGHRVPALACWPGKIKSGTRTNQLCSSLDLMPTMLKLAGIANLSALEMDGISLDQLLTAGSPLPRRHLFWNGIAMRDGPWKLVVRERNLPDAPALFNLNSDLGELNNVADEFPQRVNQMLSAIEQWKRDMQRDVTAQPDFAAFTSKR